MQDMKGYFQSNLNKKRKKTRTKLNIKGLEKEIIQQYPNYTLYEGDGGYKKFYDIVIEFTEKGLLTPLKTEKVNGRIPALKEEYWLSGLEIKPSWSEFQLLKIADKLKINVYRNRPELQTDNEWELIERVYRFLNSNETRELIGKEERSYNIFGNEKFLGSKEGKQFLKRVGLTLDDLFVEQKGEPFLWTLLNELKDKNKVLIVENLNLYHTLVRFYMAYSQIRGYKPNILIYGKGNQIPASISFFYEFFSKDLEYEVFYLGDIDAAGFGIFHALKTNAPFEIQLHIPFYRMMMDYSKGTVPYENQKNEKKVHILNDVTRKFEEVGEYELSDLVTRLWYEERRLPQEAINFEVLLKELSVGEMDG